MLNKIIHRIREAWNAYPGSCFFGSFLTFSVLSVLPLLFAGPPEEPPPSLLVILTFISAQFAIYILLSWSLPALLVSCFIKRK